MISLNATLLRGVQRFEKRYKSPKEWPKSELKGVQTVANRYVEIENERSPRTSMLRERIARGFLYGDISVELNLGDGYVKKMAKKMRSSPNFHYVATPNDLVQLKYNRIHCRYSTSKKIDAIMRTTQIQSQRLLLTRKIQLMAHSKTNRCVSGLSTVIW